MQAEVLIFKDGPHTYAIRLSEIKEIINLRKVAQLPFASPFLIGLANMRGQVVPVISPYVMHGGKGRYHADVEYASLVECDGMEAAIACQKIFGVKSVDTSSRKNEKTTPLSDLFTIEGKKVRLIDTASFVTRASETLEGAR